MKGNYEIMIDVLKYLNVYQIPSLEFSLLAIKRHIWNINYLNGIIIYLNATKNHKNMC